MAMQERSGRWYLYLGHLWHSGWTVLDVTDPTKPSLEAWIPGPPNTWTLQVQVADCKMIASLEPILDGWGRDPQGPAAEEGFFVFDVENPTEPRKVGHWRTNGDGTHRNYYDGGDIVHACAGFPDLDGRGYAAVDISEPTAPRLVGRWWWPGQNRKLGERPTREEAGKVISHHGGAYTRDNLAFCPWMGAGMVILDISELSTPQFVGRLDVHPPLGSWLAMHTCVPVRGHSFVLVNSEAIAERCAEPANFAGIVDVSDSTNPVLISLLPTPVPPPNYPASSFASKGGRFGPHNQHQPQFQNSLYDSDRYVFMTYFNAGLQIYDISDPWSPRIVAYYIPDDPMARLGPLPVELTVQCEDVLVDRRGYTYMTEKNSGLYILCPNLQDF
jgi:hypothetical protein